MAGEWVLQNPGEMIFGLADFNGHFKGRIAGFEGADGGYGIGERNVERRLLEFFDEKGLCVANTWLEKKEQRKTYSMGGNETEIDFAFGEKSVKYLKDVKAILWGW